jgi:dolichol-phosphate mannosyltransferase
VVIIPTYNERENIERLVLSILRERPELDVMVMDDGSPDGTGEIGDRLAEQDDRVSVVHRAGKQGLASAYLAGFRKALDRPYQFILQMDADFSHRVEDLPRLLEAADTADVAIGSRSVSGGQSSDRSLPRRLISELGSLYARVLLGIPVRDCTGGYKCFRRHALLAVDLASVRSKGYAFQVEMNHLCHRAGLRLVEVPIVFPDRAAGRSKMTWRIFAEAWLVVIRLRLRSLRLDRDPVADPASGVAGP